MRPADGVAVLTLLLSLFVILWIGIDAWIVTAWFLVAGVLVVLYLLGRLLARELGIQARAGRRLPWMAGGIGAFVSCTMAAGLVRVEAPLRAFWVLGLLMVLSVTSLRLAYHRSRDAPAVGGRLKPGEKR